MKIVISLSNHQFRYAMVNRPVGIGCCPKDLAGTEERPARGKDHYEYARHGIAVYNRRLTDAETKQFEMAPLVEGKDLADVADRVVDDLKEYAAGYIRQAAKDPDEFQRTVLERIKETSKGYTPSVGNLEAFTKLVLKKLEAHK